MRKFWVINFMLKAALGDEYELQGAFIYVTKELEDFTERCNEKMVVERLKIVLGQYAFREIERAAIYKLAR